ncbi:MAG: InlB B-repeat-containing protein, partial [Lachnospiraceae bacterium]|nr:InlB B-repeat-containing protein [Lachnospiraceae bacterium]
MKKKRRQQWIAMLMTVVMMFQTFSSVAMAQSPKIDGTAGQVQTEPSSDAAETELVLPERVASWSQDYETATTQEEADALRNQDEDVNLLITAKECELSGLKYGEIASASCERLDLSEMTAKLLSVGGSSEIQLKGTELEQLIIQSEEEQEVTLHIDADTKVPEIILEGNGSVLIEGNGALGLVRVTGALKKATVRATCSVLNESGEEVQLETPDGEMALAAGQQEELVLSSYMVTFMADGQVYDSKAVKPGETIVFPEQNPEKEGYIFTTWYKDEEFTESCSQFEAADGEKVFYARFVEESESIKVTFDCMGGRELEPQIFAKGETLLTRPINEIYTEKEGYSFGGWCTDPECTTAFSYTQPLEESMTLYAFFVSEEVQTTEKDGTSADMKDFDWQGSIPLRTEEKMTLEEVEKNIRVEAGSGALEPVLDITETEDGFEISGSYYEKDGETGFEPGATFSIILSGGVHFSDYSDDTDTAVVSVYKERVEVVGFSENMTYVLWDDVLEYSPIVLAEDEPEETEAESETETETETSTEAEIASETGEDPENEAVSETETEQGQSISDPDGDAAEEQEGAAYIPGELLVKDTVSYQEGDIVAFYDGEIGRDEKNIDAYTEGSLDGYVLFAQILSVEDTADGVHLTYGYASPEDYLADFDVHITDDVEMDQQLSDEDLEVLTSRLSRQVEENEELKAQMMVAVMSAPETQDMLDDMYGEGVYSLAGMNAILTPGKPVIKLKVSGSEVTATISISATAKIMKDGKALLTIQPKLAFTQSLSVQTNVDGGAVWIDMAITIRSMSKIELTVTATTGGKTSVFTKAKDSLTEIVKPEGIAEGEYDSYDESVSDLMDTMNSIVSTSLKYNDLFDILLLNLKFSFYGIITVGFEVHLVGQVGVLATFGVEIVARSGERIGFKYNFLKFKGSSYTEKLESSVTNNIYLIGKVGARVGLRLTFSVTLCGIASAYITGSLYAYAELTGLFFNTTNLLTGANTNLGALKFEVGIDVVVSLGLKVNLIIKTVRKSWTVFSGRWPLWSTSISSKMSYMDEEELSKLWEKSTANADRKSVFGFEAVPMKTWDLLNGNCQKNEQLFAKSEKYKLSIENLTLDGELVPSDDPRNAIFTVGTSGNNQNPGFIYMDELMVGQYGCSEIALDLVLTYEDHSSSALVKKQVQRFHLEKKCELSTTTQKVKVVLYDWCARNWGIEAAEWDNAQVFETSFFSSHMIGGICEQNATGTLDLGEVIVAAQSMYPELSGLDYSWGEPVKDGTTASIQYSSPRISNFCYMTTDNGVVRFDVYPGTQEYEVTYYLFIRRFEGFENMVNYHIRLNSNSTENEYAFSVLPTNETKEEQFTKDENGVYNLSLARSVFDGTQCPIKLSVNGGDPASTGFTVTGREYQKDVYFDMNFGKVQLNIALGEGVEEYQFANPEQMSEEGIQPGEKVELDVTLKEGYGGLEVLSENETIDFTVTDEKVSFVMPAQDLTITLQAYKKHSILYQYNYGGLDEYQKVYFTENEVTREVETPVIDGLTFRGWYTTADCSGEPYQFGETLTTDLILYADWTCNVTVSFGPVKGKAEYITGEEENQQVQLVFDGDESEYYVFTYSTLHVGDKLLNIQTPEYEGYQFMDWYLDAEFKTQKLDLSSYILTGGVTIYAKWARELELTYDRNDPVPNDDGQSTVIQQMVGYYGYPVPFVPEDPEYLHYRFTGWYRNPAATVPFDVTSDVLTADTTLYAGWEPVSYDITYDLDGGENASSNPASYTTEDSFVLEAPTKVGYDFVGWTGTGLEDPVEKVIVEMGDGGVRNYLAHWSPIEYTIKYEKTYDSAKNNPETYTIESGDIVLEEPER